MIALQAIRFAISAVFGFWVGVFWVWLFHEIVGWSPEVAVIMSIVLVSVQNFVVFRYYVYRTQTQRNVLEMMAQFALSVAGFRGLEYVLFLTFHTYLGYHYLYTIVVIRVILMVGKFGFYRLTIFRSDATS